MKRIILMSLLSVVTSSVALANVFDNFIGEYKTSSVRQITAENAIWCNLFGFRNIIGLKIEANTKGVAQSHALYILDPTGWSVGHPIKDFDDTSNFSKEGNYAKTSGSSSIASNEYGSWSQNPIDKEILTVTIEKTGVDFTFSMYEAIFMDMVLAEACSYQVKLVKK